MTDIPEHLTDLPGFAERVIPAEPVVAAGKAAEHEWGIQYQGSFEGEADGTARAVRLHARALAATGIPVMLQSLSYRFRAADGSFQSSEAMSDRLKQEVFALRHASIGKFKLAIKHAVIFGPDYLRAWILPRSVMQERDPELAMRLAQGFYRSTVVYSVWERTTIDPNIVAILRRVAECWVPSEHNAELLRAHGITRVTVVPHPYEETNPILRLTERRPIPERRFYAIGIWQPRKAHHELLGAFLRAFRPGEAVHLTIKYREFKWPGYPDAYESMVHWLADPVVRDNGWRETNLKPHLALRSEHWPEEKITELHFKSNIYVAASHGEAFALPAHDAKLAGNRMIYTPWGGQADFAEPDDVPVDYRMEPVPASYQWEPGAEWASVDVDALSRALVQAKAPDAFVRGERAAAMSFEKVGALMRSRVDAILAEQ